MAKNSGKGSLPQMLETYIVNFEKNIDNDVFFSLLDCLPEDKKDRVRRFKRFEDAQRTVVGDILARYAVCKRSGLKNSDLNFGKNEYGKPILLEPCGAHFNISHSGDWVACAVDDSAVGADVEVIKPIDMEIAKRFFSSDEYISLMRQPEGMRLKYFYMLWTLKESYIKAEGKGLSIPLDSFTIRIKENEASVLINEEPADYHLFQSFLDDNTVYAVCTLNGDNGKHIYWDAKQFSKEAMLFAQCR